MAAQIIEPVDIESLNIVKSLLEVNDSPADSMRVEMSLSMPSTNLSLDESGNRYSLAAELDLSVEMTDENDSNDMRMKAQVHVIAVVNTPVSIHDGSDAAMAYLETQGLAICYAHARAHISSLTAMSPVGLFTLPEINASEYVKGIREQRQAHN